ncbi:MAG: LLM class F420-dependent oxidoreductase, partial [Gammaproteobacteria bacterium]|nr:LLM class F420-dependent oxidoreductase [Gammaproteobacteria bacterium]
ANEWNVWGDVSILRSKMEILDRHCADIGRDPKEIKRTAVALLFMSDDNAFLEKMRNSDLQQPSIIGTVGEVREVVNELEAIGVDELIVPDFTLGSGDQKIATLDRFINDVAGR